MSADAAPDRGSFAAAAEMIGRYATAHPWQTVFMLLAFLVGSVAESIGFLGLLPLFDLAQVGSQSEAAQSDMTQLAANVLAAVGLEQTLATTLAIIMVAMVLKSCIMAGAEFYLAHSVSALVMSLRVVLLRAIGNARWAYFVDQSPGELATMIGTESQRAANGMINSIKMLSMVLQSLLYFSAALLVSWSFTLGAFAAGLLVAVALHRFVGMARRAGGEQTRAAAAMLSSMIDGLQGFKALKAMARERALVQLLEGEARRFRRAYMHNQISSIALSRLPEVLVVVLFGAFFYIVISVDSIPLSEIVVIAALGYRGVGRINEVQKILQQSVATYHSFRFIERTTGRVQSMPEQFHGTCAPHFESVVRLEGVEFAYGDQPVLRAVDLTVPARGVTALIGPSGAGKSTIIDLVLGLRTPDSGRMTIDGVPFRDIDIRAWRRRIGYVPQEVRLFSRSLLENITLDEPDISRADVEEALRKADAWTWVCDLPHGIDTAVGQAGLRFSGGQRQRIALARALVHRPALLLLDEATSALDPETERQICATLRDIARSVAVLAISHQPGILMIADRIYRIDAGRVYREGGSGDGVADASERVAGTLRV